MVYFEKKTMPSPWLLSGGRSGARGTEGEAAHSHVPKDEEVTWPCGTGGQRGWVGSVRCWSPRDLCRPSFPWQTGFYADLLLPRSWCKNSISS